MEVLQRSPTQGEPDAPPVTGTPFSEELVIREARRRQRRRWLGLGITAVVIVGAGLALTTSTGHTPSRTRPKIQRTSPRPPVTVAAPACSPSHLSVDVGFVQGASQSWDIPLQFTNASSARCSVTGYPRVFLLNAQGQQVGLAIKPTSGGWADRTVTLSHAQTAEADLWQPDTTDAVEAGQPCLPIEWSAIRITLPAAVVVSGSSGGWSKATMTCGAGEVAPWITPLHMVGPPAIG